MTRGPAFGITLATFGALVLTPDAMLMRLSGMEGFQMMGWRGLCMGTAMVALWFAFSRTHRADLRALVSGAGLLVVACQFFNAMLFCLGIAAAPVAVVLFGVASVPIFAALFAWLLMGERTDLGTWITIGAVFTGIAIAVLGDGPIAGATTQAALWGAIAGLGVAAALALNFVVLRAQGQLPILLLIGVGALCAGGVGFATTGLAEMGQGQIWVIALTGALVLPLSFFCLSLAARYTPASNVSLLLLLETVLGPLWVWLVLGESITPAMGLGGAIVVGSLALYLLNGRRRRRA
ncbi:DMT family transporter [Rhodobacteraceae bacterium KMM 6894]|nr:DMT family transporter [Rhodobacteraceae bacterium KMM 6894]